MWVCMRAGCGQHHMEEEEDAAHVTMTKWQRGSWEAAASSSQREKVCQEVEAASSIRPHPQTMRDVDLKASISFSNKQVRGGCEGPAWGT